VAEVQLGEGHEEEAAEGGAEEGAVHGLEAAVGWGVDVETAGAVQFDGFLAGGVGSADGEDARAVAEDAGAVAEVAEVVLFHHLLDAWAGGDEAGVDQAVEEFGGRFDDRGVAAGSHVSSWFWVCSLGA
jgi:hypothetical protein